MGLLVWSAGCNSTSTRPSPPPAVAKEQVSRPDANVPADAVVMALRFVPGQTTTYKLTTQTERQVDYMGNVPEMPDDLKAGRVGSRISMVFDQQVERVDPNGAAVLRITIKSLTYVGESKGQAVLDFDSTRETDARMPLAKLIGQSYALLLSPGGVVLSIVDAQAARAAVAGNVPGSQTAQKLLSEEAIKERHGIPALAVAPKKTVRPGDTWVNVKVVSFGLMGTDTLQQNYKLAALDQPAGRRVAVVEMEAIPSSVMAQQLHQQVSTPVGPGRMDNTQKDVGRLRLDLTNQRIDEYTEDLTKEWVTVLPEKTPGAGYAGMKMTATQRYRLERVE